MDCKIGVCPNSVKPGGVSPMSTATYHHPPKIEFFCSFYPSSSVVLAAEFFVGTALSLNFCRTILLSSQLDQSAALSITELPEHQNKP